MTATTALATRRKRPLAVTILTWVLFLGSILNIAAGALSIYSFTEISQGITVNILDEGDTEVIFTDEGGLLVEGIWYLLAGVVQLIITIGFWRLMRWAWVAAMSWQALKLLVDVSNGLSGNPEVVALVVSILLVFLLNQSDVRRVFGIRRNPNEPASTVSINSFDSN